MFNGHHYERIKDFLIHTQDNGLNYSLQDLDVDHGEGEGDPPSKYFFS
jgi:hypothetical protein